MNTMLKVFLSLLCLLPTAACADVPVTHDLGMQIVMNVRPVAEGKAPVFYNIATRVVKAGEANNAVVVLDLSDNVTIADMQSQLTTVPGLIPRLMPITVPLLDGTVLIAGGMSESGTPLRDAQIVDPIARKISKVGQMVEQRQNPAVVRLPNGKVLIAGGLDFAKQTFSQTAEIYDPETGAFSATGSLPVSDVVVSGGGIVATPAGVYVAGAVGTYLYDYKTGAFTQVIVPTALVEQQTTVAAGAVNGFSVIDIKAKPTAGNVETSGAFKAAVHPVSRITVNPTATKPADSAAITVPGAPQRVEVIAAAKGGALLLAYLPPVDDGGSEILDYTVTVASASGTTVKTIVSKGNCFGIPGLASGVEYTVSVKARNKSGFGQAATFGPITTL